MGWLTTALILIPLGGALLVWLFPWDAFTAGAIAVLTALAEVGVWIESLVRFNFDRGGLQLDQRTNWFADLHVSYHVGMYGFSLWLVGLTVVVQAASVIYAFWSGRTSARAYFGLMLLLTAVILVLAAIGLVYGSLLAFRAPDIRGVIAYSSLAQLGLITFGVFAVNDLGLNGAVLQMVNHGLISASLFLLAGGIERRGTTGEFSRLRGFARGRPLLATGLMTTGIIALAVPGSSAFAGEFAILAGVFTRGWGYAVVGAVAIVLAAMYMLRLISAVLHEARGPAVVDEALDLRPAELGAIAPLLACLLALSVWPAAITERSFAADTPESAVGNQFRAVANPASKQVARLSRVLGSNSASAAECLKEYGRALNAGQYASAYYVAETC